MLYNVLYIYIYIYIFKHEEQKIEMANNDMAYDSNILFGDNTDVTDDGQDVTAKLSVV